MGARYRIGTVELSNGGKTVTGTMTKRSNLIFGVSPGTALCAPVGWHLTEVK